MVLQAGKLEHLTSKLNNEISDSCLIFYPFLISTDRIFCNSWWFCITNQIKSKAKIKILPYFALNTK